MNLVKKFLVWLGFFVLIASSCSKKQIVIKEQEMKQKLRIAVLLFSDADIKSYREKNIGKVVSNILIRKLVNTKKFKVIEREQLDKILQEHKLKLSGVIDQESRLELGKILDVELLLIGKVIEFEVGYKETGFVMEMQERIGKVRLEGRLVDVNTGEIVCAGEGYGENTSSSLEILDITIISEENFGETLLGEATEKACDELVNNILSSLSSGKR
ncbi:MAG: CsgG/HfaB family protein [Elusimicrobiota bacterium]